MTKRPKPPIAVYSALADVTRCRIIEILLAGPIPVHALADAFSISRPAISRHLRVLKRAGLVGEVKKGRENLYALKTAKLAGAVKWLEAIAAPVVVVAGAVSAPEPKSALPVQVAPTNFQKTAAAEPPPKVPAAKTRALAQLSEDDSVPRAAKVAPVSQMGFDF